jgi:hypothetical protein
MRKITVICKAYWTSNYDSVSKQEILSVNRIVNGSYEQIGWVQGQIRGKQQKQFKGGRIYAVDSEKT